MRWQALAWAVALPLLASVVAAYLGSAVLGALLRRRADGAGFRSAVLPVPSLAGACPAALTRLHWMSAGAVGVARGLNDTPKLAAVSGFVLLPAGVPAPAIVVGVAVAMFLGAMAVGGVSRGAWVRT